MTTNTTIEWTDHTFNPWQGCTRVSAGCAHCYAETIGKRFGVKWGDAAMRKPAAESTWELPRRWNRAAAKAGRRARVFCASMADVFDSLAPEDSQARLFDLILFTPWLDWQLLTKRPENILKALPADWGRGYRNAWLGVSVENQAAADTRIALLLQVPAAVRFLSCEPLLGPVNLNQLPSPGTNPYSPLHFSALHEKHDDCMYSAPALIDWVIVGGESGRKARGMRTEWARDLRDQCQAAGVPFLFKQWGEWGPYNLSWDTPESLAMLENPKTFDFLRRHGKRAAGRLLDGREWNEFPERTLA